MTQKEAYYAAMAEKAIHEITKNQETWTAFLTTAAKFYKYPFLEQVMIHKQRPDATACAEYAFWNNRWGRSIKRGSKGVALVNYEGNKINLRYVFDVADTEERMNARPVKLWFLREEHHEAVRSALTKAYAVPSENDLTTQLERIAQQQATGYWKEHDIRYIVDGSLLEEYDKDNLEVRFKRAVTVSVSYILMSRCGIETESYFEPEDFAPIVEFSTNQTCKAMGIAVSQISQDVLRQIEAAIKNHEHEHRTERNEDHERDHLQTGRRRSSPEHRTERGGENTAGQVRNDAKNISGETPSDSFRVLDAEWNPTQAPAGNRRAGQSLVGRDDAKTRRRGRSDRGTESQRSDEVGRTYEQLQSTSGGDHLSGIDLQLSFLSPTGGIEAENVADTSSAFSFSQSDIDQFLRYGGNTDRQRERVVAEFSKQKSTEENAAYLQSVFHGGNGITTENGNITAWYAEDGIHLSRTKSARYDNSAQIVSWASAAERVSQLLEEGSFATNVELIEAGGYERSRLAEKLLYLYRDLSADVRKDFLLSLSENPAAGFPDEVAWIFQRLSDPTFRAKLSEEYEGFLEAYGMNREILRFHYHRTKEIAADLADLELPRKTFETDMTKLPSAQFFITEDEIDAALARGSSFAGGKSRIYPFFLQEHTTKEKADFLRQEYGTFGGHSDALSGSRGSWEEHDSRGERFQKEGCPDVILTWEKVARRITDLIHKDRYLTAEEQQAYEKTQAEKNLAEVEEDQNRIEQPVPAGEVAGQDDIEHVDPLTLRENLAERGIVNGQVVDMEKLDADPFIQQVMHDTERISAENVKTVPEKPAQEQVQIQNTFHPTTKYIDHFYVVEDLQVQGSLVLSEYNTFEDALRAYQNLPSDRVKALGAAKIPNPLPGSLDLMQCIDGQDKIIQDYTKVEGWEHPEILDVVQKIKTVIQAKETFDIEQLSSDENLISIEVDGEWKTFPNIAAAQKAASKEYDKNIRRNAKNFHIMDSSLGEGGAKAKFQANLYAIKLLKELESYDRQAIPEQQQVLSRYVGWGGLSDAFDPDKPAWSKEYQELKETLTPAEYEAARASTLNAHYTSPTVIKAMYEAVGNMGFETGNILEPSCGVGNFFGMLPEQMQASRLYGVELDSISGRIAKQLYPKADITVAGFETTNRQDFFDLVIGNVPFGNYQVADKPYDKLGFSIHNYFFAKSIDQVRPGGVIAFVTSRFTMDSKNIDARRYIAQRAELLGAIRLPNDAFKKNAGTEVVSDIIFLQKRDQVVDMIPDWVYLNTTDDGYTMNNYFVEHPEMVLGELATESTQYGKDDLTVRPYGDLPLAEQLKEAIQRIDGSYRADRSIDFAEESQDTYRRKEILPDPAVKNYSYTVIDGEIYYRENDQMVLQEINSTAKERIKGMIALRDCTRQLIAYQLEDYSEEDIRGLQQRLNEIYDSFSRQYGRISDRANHTAFHVDNSYYLLTSLEVTDSDGKFVRKADMFSKRTIKQKQIVTSVGTASEALIVSLAEKVKVDLPYMAELTGKSEKALVGELRGVIFQLPLSGEYVTADEYLSGNVREKLREAKQAAETDPAYQANVSALEAVQPVDLTPGEISVRLGATWIPTGDVQQFMFELFDTPNYARWNIKVHYSKVTGTWNIEGKSQDRSSIKARSTYGTQRINGYKIIEETLNLKDVRIFDYIEDQEGRRTAVLNKKETAIAQAKQELIKQAFVDWIWKDPERRNRLCTQYNEQYNSVRSRQYDGSHLNFVGINPEINLRPHQVNAIAHIIYGGNTLLAHVVGAGKTFEVVAAAQESKRLGLCQKSMIAVPNHLTEQWATEYLQLYPSANILVVTKKDFEPKNRKKFCARIAASDIDAVIIGHSQLEKIPMSVERQKSILEEQMQEVVNGIADLKAHDGERFSIKQMEKTKKTLEAKLKKLNDQSRKDDVVTFEELGVDRLFVDEAHSFKNLAAYTKMRNVAGISQTEAQKSSDLYMKCRYLDELTGGRGVIFATGTPISNSMVEMYTMQKYLQHDLLKEKELLHFDAWASTFGETVTAMELAPEGTGYRSKTRFARFYNLPELMTMFRDTADIQTADMLNLPVPKAEYHNIVLQPSEHQKEMVQTFAERAESVRNKQVDSSVDNMLLITNDGRKLALDQRLLNPILPESDTGKISACANNVFDIWQRTAEQKSTQMIFCDLSTPKNDGNFNVYDDLRDKLIAHGIPAKDIAYIHDANTEAKKKELFGKVNSGEVRILLGSTQKMGAGTNCQKLLIALHHLDCPWRPADLQQREGRIIRQGNENSEVHIYTYLTENTFDSYLYQLVESKQKFIGQIMTSKSPVRSAEDIDEAALSYAEIKALCTGNPYIKEKMDLDVEVQRLKLLKSNYLTQKYAMEDQIAKVYPQNIAALEQRCSAYQSDIAVADAYKNMDFSIEINGRVYDEKKEAGVAILNICKTVKSHEPIPLGAYHGFSLALSFDAMNHEFVITMQNNLKYTVRLGDDPHGNIQRIDNVLSSLSTRLENCKDQLTETKKQLAIAQVEVQKPFAQEEALQTKSMRLAKLDALLNMDGTNGNRQKPLDRGKEDDGLER